MSALNILQPTTAEIRAVERVLHEALSDNGVSEPDGFFIALAESVLETSRDARLREFVAEVRPELYAGEATYGTICATDARTDDGARQTPLRLVTDETVAAFDRALGEGRR